MTQLLLDVDGYGLILPESIKGGYTIQEEPLAEHVDMISGRRTKEYRGMVWAISHQYGYLTEEEKNAFIGVCKKGTESTIMCSFLVPEENILQISSFFVTDFRRPKFMWSRSSDGTPLWGDYYIALREVRPHA